MVIILTIFIVILCLGLVLLVMGFKGRTTAPPAAPAESGDASDPTLGYSTLPRRRLRLVPLVLGLLLTLAGGAAVGWVFSEGLDSDRFEKYVLAWTPAGWLADDLDADDFSRRYTARTELQRRADAGDLPADVEQRLMNRQIARLMDDPEAPDAPAPGAPVVELKYAEARGAGRVNDATWGQYVALTAPLRFDVPRRAAPGEPITLRLVLSLADPEAPAWLIVRVEDLKIDGKDVPALPAVAIAPNPQWKRPPEPTTQPAIDPNAPPGPPPGPPPIRRVSRHEFELPADLVADLGLGAKQVTGRLMVYAFDPTELAPPEQLSDEFTFMPRARSDEPTSEQMAAALSAKLSPEQAADLIGKALGNWKYDIDRRMQIGEATEPTTRRAEPDEAAAEGESPQSGQ